MRFVFGLLLSTLFLMTSFPAFAQKPETPNPEVMNKLAFLVGNWQGEGSIMMGPGQKRTFTGTETVSMKLDGTILVIEGFHKSPATADGPERVIHNALAVVSFDRASGKYKFQSYLSDGRATGAEASVPEKDTFVWSMTDARGGTSRFTIKLDEKGDWVEIGEYSMDGKAWRGFFEMRMKKVK